jgi:TRAP-type C4-dicarboxylate transport system substrate-binding protein
MSMHARSFPLKALGAVALFGLTASASAQVVLATSTWVPPTHLLSRAQAAWCEDVAKATQERVRCNILPRPVSPPPATFDAIRDGQADLSFSVHGYTPGRYVMTGLAEFPFLGDSAVATSVAYERIYRRHLAQFNEHRGLKVLTVFTHGPGIIFNNKKPIRTLADMEGIKFRVGGGIVNEIGKAIGANMTLRPASQAYEMLSSGVMDGNWFPDESVVSFKLERLTKHRTALPGGAYNTSFAFVMNEATWNRISKADQEVIERLSGEAAARRFGMAWDEVDAVSRDVQRQNGVTFDDADARFVADYKARTAPLEADWIKKAEDKGLRNAGAVLAEFRAEIAKVR